jgi:hypothetical protein
MYKPTSKDMQTLKYRAPAVMGLYFRYKVNQDTPEGEKRNAVLEGFRIRDVTLRFKSNTPYYFESCTTIFLPVELAGYDKVLEKKTQQTALLHCISELRKTMQSARIPKNMRSVIIVTSPDDFEAKLAAHPFADYYPGYVGVNEPDIVAAAVVRELQNLRRSPFVSAVMAAPELDPRESYLGSLMSISHFLWKLHMDGLAWLRSQGEEKDSTKPPQWRGTPRSLHILRRAN